MSEYSNDSAVRATGDGEGDGRVYREVIADTSVNRAAFGPTAAPC